MQGMRCDKLDKEQRFTILNTTFARCFPATHLFPDTQHGNQWLWHHTNVHSSCFIGLVVRLSKFPWLLVACWWRKGLSACPCGSGQQASGWDMGVVWRLRTVKG